MEEKHYSHNMYQRAPNLLEKREPKVQPQSGPHTLSYH